LDNTDKARISDHDVLRGIHSEPYELCTDQQEACLDCQECCEAIEFPTSMVDNKVMEFYIAYGIDFYITKAGVVIFRMNHPCPHITETGCDIYDDRPDVCKEFMCSTGDGSIKELKKKACADAKNGVLQAINDEKLAKQTNKEG